MAEQILFDDLYNQLTPEEQFEYGGYKVARNIGGEEDANTMAEGTNFQEIFNAQQAAEKTKPSMWNPMNWIFTPAASSELPQNQYGLVNTNIGNNLPFTSMADMAAANQNFMKQFKTGEDYNMSGPLRGTNVMEGSVIGPDMSISDYQYPSGTDILGMDEMNTYGNTIAEALIDENRIPGRVQESVPNYQSGWDKFTGKIGDVWSGAKNKLSNLKMPPIGIMGLIQAMNRNPFDIDSRNYSKGLGLQVDDLRKVGFLPQKTADGYKILGGPLAGKNLVSAFGTNDYDEMLAKKFAWFQKRKDLGKGFSQKNWDKVKKEQEARAAEMRAHGQRGVGERTLGGNFQIERGGSDAVNRDLARREAANRNRSRAARQDTTSMRSAGRSYTDAQGNRGYSRGRRDGGRIGYANGGLASLFTRRG
jgi:hypothetical protein